MCPFVTSLHVLNAALIHGSKLTVVRKVYRSITGISFPRSFVDAPNEYGGLGGAEPGFMSTTSDERVAENYADSEDASVVISIRPTTTDRPCDLAKLGVSQFDESEMTFPPLTWIEVTGLTANAKSLLIDGVPRVKDSILSLRYS